MGDRISIPTSDSRDSIRRPNGSVGRVLGLIGAVLVALLLFAALGDRDAETADVVSVEDQVAPPPAVDEIERPLDSVVFPGTGSVTAVTELDGDLIAAQLSDSFLGTAIWRLDDASQTWVLTDALEGVAVLDMAPQPDGLVVVGFDRFDRSPALIVGRLGSLHARPIEMGAGQIPHRVEFAGGDFFVLSRFGDSFTSSLPGSVYRVDASWNLERLRSEDGDSLIGDIFERDGDVVAVGSAGGEPGAWGVGADGVLEPIEMGIDVTGGRISAAGVTESGEVLGLVVGLFEGSLLSTAVYRLEAPYDQMDEPTPGTWNRLVQTDGGLLALPADGVVMYRTTDGVVWDEERASYEDLQGVSAEPTEQPMIIEDAVVRSSGETVFAGTTSGRHPRPAVGSRSAVGRQFDIPSAKWALVEEVDSGVGTVHVGGIQVAIREGVVVVRDGFEQRWTQPVFADEPSVGGLVEVVELDFGYLLTVTRPYPSLWFSSDGTAWQLIARDPIRVTGSGGEAVAFVGPSDDISVFAIGRTGLVQRARGVDLLPVTGDRLGHVDGLGYVSGPVDGTVFVSADGVEWFALEFGLNVDSIQPGSDSLAIRTSSGWLRYGLSDTGLTPIRSPLGPLAPTDQMFVVNGGLLFTDRAQSWVTSDFMHWTDVSLGVWAGADGVLLDVWVDEDRVVGMIGGSADRSFYTLER